MTATKYFVTTSVILYRVSGPALTDTLQEVEDLVSFAGKIKAMVGGINEGGASVSTQQQVALPAACTVNTNTTSVTTTTAPSPGKWKHIIQN